MLRVYVRQAPSHHYVLVMTMCCTFLIVFVCITVLEESLMVDHAIYATLDILAILAISYVLITTESKVFTDIKQCSH